MGSSIEVRITGKGSVRDGDETEDTSMQATCDLCGEGVDAVASCSPAGDAPFACKACLRRRLEAMTVGAWQLRDSTGIPWGKFSG